METPDIVVALRVGLFLQEVSVAAKPVNSENTTTHYKRLL
jgi:hypothetical protein